MKKNSLENHMDVPVNDILVTAFRGSSAERLLSFWEENGFICGTYTSDRKTAPPELILTGTVTECTRWGMIAENDREICGRQIEKAVVSQMYRYIFCFGQRPNIKDKVHIETQAKGCGQILQTEFDCGRLRNIFEKNGITAKLSYSAGTSFCNHIYYKGLAAGKNNCGKIVFVHIPFEKNISEFNKFAVQLICAVCEFCGCDIV